jgi:uncharacterized membrane protein
MRLKYNILITVITRLHSRTNKIQRGNQMKTQMLKLTLVGMAAALTLAFTSLAQATMSDSSSSSGGGSSASSGSSGGSSDSSGGSHDSGGSSGGSHDSGGSWGSGGGSGGTDDHGGGGTCCGASCGTPVPEANALFPLAGLVAAVVATKVLRKRRAAQLRA